MHKNMTKQRLCLCLCLLPFLRLWAQVPTGLETIFNHTLDSMHAIHGSKGLGAAVILPDGSIWSGAAGISSVFPPKDITTDDAFLIGSVTKMITAACVLQLVEEGVLSLSDSLGAWLDTLPSIDPNGYINRKVTIRQLLRHQSGIYDVLSHPANQSTLLADQDRIWTPEALIETFIGPPLFQPGATWSYSNTNYFLLDMIIRKASGRAFYQEYRDRFFTPLEMESTAIPAFEPLNSPVAHVWLDITGDGITDDAHTFYMNYLALNSTAGAAGGYFSTPAETAKWLQAYLRNDFVSPALMAEAKTMVTAPGQPVTYGLGLMRRMFQGVEGFGHGGDLAYAASAWYFPARDISIVVMTNDSKKNSWTLIPTVTALLRKYNEWLATTTHVADHSNQFSAVLCPNPFTSSIELRVEGWMQSGVVQLILRDLAGRELARSQSVESREGPLNIELGALDELPAGCYLVEICQDGRLVYTLKAIK